MGKHQHAKAPMHLTRKEWKECFGGFNENTQVAPDQGKALPFYCCGMSLAPAEDPVCTRDGTVFDIVNILPYIKKHKTNPVDGKPLRSSDLITLHFHKNAEGKYHCPVSFKVFNDNSHIVAIATTGNVYSHEVVDKLCLKAKKYQDLLSGEAFDPKTDVIPIQDPKDMSQRTMERFKRARAQRDAESSSNSETELLGSSTSTSSSTSAPEPPLKKARPSTPSSSSSSSSSSASSRPLSFSSSGLCAASFTSTALAPRTANPQLALSDQEMFERRYKLLLARGNKGRRGGNADKAFVTLVTSKGKLNLQLDCDLAPRTCHNFLLLCERGYYKNTIFHRLIRGFMVQGGDPTATGMGGKSAWGRSFPDEFHRTLTHAYRGTLSMANSGPNTNGSQFFITFGAAPHLDNKHAVFGRVVGGMATLTAIEMVETGDEDRPKEDIKILDTTVFQNPFSKPDPDDAEEERKREEKERLERLDEEPLQYYSAFNLIGQSETKTARQNEGGVGRYIHYAATQAQQSASKLAGSAQSKTSGGFNFDRW